jgi:hypothetical protein
MKAVRDQFRFSLDENVTKNVSYAPAALDLKLGRYRELSVTLQIFSASRDNGNETYDFYLICGNALGEWDLAHFPQIASTGAKVYEARILADLQPETITTGAAPDVATNDPAILRIDTAGANQGPKTLAAGVVRHGPFGHKLRYELVVGNVPIAGVNYTLRVKARY